MDEATIKRYYDKRVLKTEQGILVVGNLNDKDPDIMKTIVIANFAHLGQMDKGGHAFIYHPVSLAEEQIDKNAIIVALLHDVVEDTPITTEILAKQGYSKEILDALEALCHKKGETYFAYYAKCKANPLAFKVKQSDLLMNLDLNRLNWVRSKDAEREIRYEAAIKGFTEDIYKKDILFADDRSMRNELAKILAPVSLDSLVSAEAWGKLLGDVYALFNKYSKGVRPLEAHILLSFYFAKDHRPLIEVEKWDARVTISCLKYLSVNQKDFDSSFSSGVLLSIMKSLKVSLLATGLVD